jgi:diguanylate cyclase (GGDEF)-like protein/PAS domain S-box-containing protein
MIAFLIYFWVARKLVKPIKTLLAAAESFSYGDLSQRVKIIRDDEIGKISSAFNTMADKMYQLIHYLEIRVKERTSELEQANDALSKTKEELYLILDSTAEGIFGIDLEGKCTFCNNSCIYLLGYEKQSDLLGRRMHELVQNQPLSGKLIPFEESKTYRTLTTGEKAHISDDVYWRADGTSIDVEYYSYPQYKEDQIIGAVITFMDITERNKTEAQIRYLSCHDTLTGLMNRSYLEEALIMNDKEEKLPISIIFADLNGLKLVNDVFGHATGDNLIKRAGNILKKSCRTTDIIARVGGDEFIILMPKTNSDKAQQIVDRIKLELMKETVNEVQCSMALGFDTKTNTYQDIEKIMVNAESEMYKEKLNLRKSFAQDTISNLIRSLQKKSIKEKTHSETVAKLCSDMGKALGLPEHEVKKLSEAGYLHDIGKVALDEEILCKMDLDEHEKQQMHLHPVIGYRILNLFDETLDLAPGIYGHHEKWDGTGYPKGLKGQEIPMISRIISLVESYERRLARYELPEAEVREIIFQELREDAASIFDPELVEKFIQMMQKKEES